MTYCENGLRIGRLLEERIPLLRKDTKGKDFRPGGGKEEIVSGINFRRKAPEIFLGGGETQVDETGPIDFRVAFGGEKLCRDACEVLTAYGVECQIKEPTTELVSCDGETSRVNIVTWRLCFTLPQDWTL